ncbi:MAG: AAA family ATPase [Thermoanaerobaculales bacterium]
MSTLEAVLAKLPDARKSGAEWIARCPAHDDKSPSLAIREGSDGRVLLHCHAGCRLDAVLAIIGLNERDLFADGSNSTGLGEPVTTYDYVDEAGRLLFQVCRFEPKAFRHRRPDGLGGWIWSLDGTRRVLYRLPEVQTAITAGKQVFVLEGEKDADAVRRAGFTATCNPGGAGKWRAEYNEHFRRADVTIIADRDEPGRRHARTVEKELTGVAVKVAVVEPAVGKDVSDHLAAGKTLEQLVPMMPPSASSLQATPWDHAQPAPEFLAARDADQAFHEPKIVAPGAVTEMFSPRGLCKTHLGHALGVRLARRGLRVLLLDRDNPPREVRRRLRGWGAASAPTFKVLTRAKAPALTDAAAWAAFPVEQYDVVIIDSLDAATEGIGEQDSSRPSRALAPILDLARRENGPAVLVLGNTIKSAAHSRGSGVVEDRADIVYEVRDATDLKPTGTKPWWEELPAAGAEAWAQRATRRRRRNLYRLALVPSKFRIGEEPDPFVLEVSFASEPWTLRDVTDELVAVGDDARREAEQAAATQRAEAAAALARHVAAQTGRSEIVTLGEAEDFLCDHGLRRGKARTLLEGKDGWRIERRKDLRGRPRVLLPPGEEKAAAEIPPPQTPSSMRDSERHSRRPSAGAGRRESPSRPQAQQGFSEGGIPAEPSDTPRRCPKGHAMRHHGTDPAIGWVCPTCYPEAEAALAGTDDPLGWDLAAEPAAHGRGAAGEPDPDEQARRAQPEGA